MANLGIMGMMAEFVMHAIFGAIVGAGCGTPLTSAGVHGEAERLRRAA